MNDDSVNDDEMDDDSVSNSKLPDIPGNRFARHSDPITSRMAGRGNFGTQKFRACLIIGWLADEQLPLDVIRDDVERFCTRPRIQALWGEYPLGKSPWHRVTDARGAGLVADIYDENTGDPVVRMSSSHRPQMTFRLTEDGRAIARQVYLYEQAKGRIR